MPYISSKAKKSTGTVTATTTAWQTICETEAITLVPGAQNKVRLEGWFRATGVLLGGDVRVVLNDGTNDLELSIYEVGLGTLIQATLDETTGQIAPSAPHTARLQCRSAGVGSSVTVSAGDGILKMTYATT